MKTEEIYKQLVEKEDLDGFTKMIKACRDAYIKPLNIKDSKTLKELEKDYSRLNHDYENDLCNYVTKLVNDNNINRIKLERTIEIIDLAFEVAYLHENKNKVLDKLFFIYKRHDIDINEEDIDFVEIIDWDVSKIIQSYFEKNNLENREDGTHTSANLYASHYINNISVVAKIAYMITEIGNLNRFNDKLCEELVTFIKKWQKTTSSKIYDKN